MKSMASSVNIEQIEKKMEDDELLFQEQLRALKDELKKTKKELEVYKKNALTLGDSKAEITHMLKQSFDKLIDEIQLTPKNKEYVLMMMKILGYKDEEMINVGKKKKKGIMNMFK